MGCAWGRVSGDELCISDEWRVLNTGWMNGWLFKSVFKSSVWYANILIGNAQMAHYFFIK